MPLLHVLPRGSGARGEDASALTNSLGSLCKACRPEFVALHPTYAQVDIICCIDKRRSSCVELNLHLP
ncbi:hypothetical protein D1007_16375 [Hordeum vulgare]|nr:hypothetical protein D1007_16375 [Hordeum vulgare]